MGWDSGSRANLATLRKDGVVAVRYKAQGCNVELEVLSNCIGTAGKYSYQAYPESDSKIMRNNQELYAELPIGAARLGGKLKGGRALRTDYTLVGMHVLPAGSTYQAADLKGPDCDRATHVVSRVYLGGFKMVAGEIHQMEVAARVFGAGGGASQQAGAEHVAEGGRGEACEEAQKDGKENTGCSVPLRVGLLAISGRAEGGCPSGSSFDGTQCVQKQVVTQVECPAGSKLENGRCIASVSTTCSAGLHFEAGRGCVPDATAAPPTTQPSQPAQPPSGQPQTVVTSSRVEIKQQIYFEANQSSVQTAHYQLLNEIADLLKKNPQIKRVRIEGHNDYVSSGKKGERAVEHDASQRVSELRAGSVFDYLVRRGVEASRLEVAGYGSEKPIADNSTPAGRAQNRRVQFVILDPR